MSIIPASPELEPLEPPLTGGVPADPLRPAPALELSSPAVPEWPAEPLPPAPPAEGPLPSKEASYTLQLTAVRITAAAFAALVARRTVA
jgi:hypothetical protein